MPIGAGGCPAGVAAAGYGVPDTANVPNNAILPDANTGLPQTGRFIDPATKSYQFTADGRLRGVPTVQQLVQLALTTVRGSACLSNLGQTFAQIQEKGTNFQKQVTASVTQALSDLVNNKQIAILSVSVQNTPGKPTASIGQVTWVDLTTGLQDTASIGP